MIEGVVGVTIWTDSVERLVPFYRDVLGLPVHSVRPDWVSFRFGEMRLNLGLHSQVAGVSRDPYRIMVHLGVRDIHALYARLKERGVEFIRPPEREEWGGWVATFRDPDGNVLQLLQQGE
jgi:predicted enzyme related to lactoylglutathione lyase